MSFEAAHEFDDVFALASGQGVQAIAVFRLSGPGVWQKLRPFLASLGRSRKSRKSGPAVAGNELGDDSGCWLVPRRMTYCNLLSADRGEVLDDLLAVYYPAAQSFTGEPSIELFPHGGPFILASVSRLLLGAGFLAAGPGEFTRRAYLNGKIDLIAAEGIYALTESLVESQWRVARHLIEGALATTAGRLRKELVAASAFLEARIDFPDERETAGVGLDAVVGPVQRAQVILREMQSSYRSGRVGLSGLRVVLLGAPNAGKSTLLNGLLGRDRAIVSPIPGTTRDYIEERLMIEGRLFVVVDTAGVRKTEDEIEHLGIERSLEMAQGADMVLWVQDGSAEFKGDIAEAREMVQARLAQNMKQSPHWLSVFTKHDLLSGACPESKGAAVSGVAVSGVAVSGVAVSGVAVSGVAVSGITKKGFDELRQLLCQQFDLIWGYAGGLGAESRGKKSTLAGASQPPLLATERQHFAVQSAVAGLENFVALLQGQTFDELLAFELREVIAYLGELIGEVHTDELLDEIFSKFCIGK